MTYDIPNNRTIEQLSVYEPDPKRVVCKIPQCDAKHYSRGWCAKHYRRFQRNQPVMDKCSS